MSDTVWSISNKNYTEEELHQLWGSSSSRLTTHCWMSAVVRTADREVNVANSNNSIYAKKRRDKILHAEFLALRNNGEISEKLTEICENKTENSIFDLAFWITNSPCSDCRKLISERMEEIQFLFPEMQLRLLLFFSSLYCDEVFAVDTPEEEKFDKALDQLRDWIVSLISVKISVIIGPIIVSKMVPEPKEVKETKINRIPERKRRDLHFLVLFRKLKRKILPYISARKFSFTSSQTAFTDGPLDQNILDGISANNLFYFSIFPSENPQLSEISPVFGLFLYSVTYFFVFRGHCGVGV